MKIGQENNCEKCGAYYSQYDVKNEKDSDWAEKWCEFPLRENGKIKKPKGLCQFCNPKSILYNK